MTAAKYLLVTVNDEGEHEIVFVTSDLRELNLRWLAYAGDSIAI